MFSVTNLDKHELLVKSLVRVDEHRSSEFPRLWPSSDTGGGLVVVCMTSFTSMIGVTSYVRLLNCYKRLLQPGFLQLGVDANEDSPSLRGQGSQTQTH